MARILATVKPWPAAMDTSDHSSRDWTRLIQAARALQTATPSSIESTLKNWQENKIEGLPYTAETASKLYLAIRVAFQLPQRAPVNEQFGFGGWVQHRFRQTSPENGDGTINLAWPLLWDAGRPRLVSGFLGIEGPRYDAASEYHYLLGKYRFRDLSSFTL